MASLKDLSKTELLSFIIENVNNGNININDDLSECYICGNNSKKYLYECDKCEKNWT
jgi:hypothetical protein